MYLHPMTSRGGPSVRSAPRLLGTTGAPEQTYTTKHARTISVVIPPAGWRGESRSHEIIQILNPCGLIAEYLFEFFYPNAIKFVVQGHDLHLRLEVDFVIEARGHPITSRLAVLRHQDHWRL